MLISKQWRPQVLTVRCRLLLAELGVSDSPVRLILFFYLYDFRMCNNQTQLNPINLQINKRYQEKRKLSRQVMSN